MTNTSLSHTSWPITGFFRFLMSPSLWVKPLIASLISAAVTVASVYATLYFLWPESDASIFTYIMNLFFAFGCAIGVLMVLWMLVLPLIFMLAFEWIIREVYIKKQIPIDEERLVPSMFSAFRVFVSSLGWRLMWPLAAIATGFLFPPLGILIGFIGAGHVTVLDSADMALSLRGLKGKQRTEYFRTNRNYFISTGGTAGLLCFLLAFTIIGWVFWLPSIYCGAAHWGAKFSEDELGKM